MIPTTTPTADLRLSYNADITTGTTLVDLVLSPNHDLQLVWGLDRLEQDIRRWLQLALGKYPFDITWGNPLWAELGRPIPFDPVNVVLAALSVAETNFLQAQQIAAQQGFLSTDEQLDRFENVRVALPNDHPGVLFVDLVLVARSGNNRPAELWVPYGPVPTRTVVTPPPRPVLTTRQPNVGPGQQTVVLVTYSGIDVLHLSVSLGGLSRNTITPAGPLGVPVVYEVTYTAPSLITVEQQVLVTCTDSTDTVTLPLVLEPEAPFTLAWDRSTLIVGGLEVAHLIVTYSGLQTITLSVTHGTLAQYTVVGTGTAQVTSIPYTPPSPLGDAGDEFLPGSGFFSQTWPFIVASGVDATETRTASLMVRTA